MSPKTGKKTAKSEKNAPKSGNSTTVRHQARNPDGTFAAKRTSVAEQIESEAVPNSFLMRPRDIYPSSLEEALVDSFSTYDPNQEFTIYPGLSVNKVYTTTETIPKDEWKGGFFTQRIQGKPFEAEIHVNTRSSRILCTVNPSVLCAWQWPGGEPPESVKKFSYIAFKEFDHGDPPTWKLKTDVGNLVRAQIQAETTSINRFENALRLTSKLPIQSCPSRLHLDTRAPVMGTFYREKTSTRNAQTLDDLVHGMLDLDLKVRNERTLSDNRNQTDEQEGDAAMNGNQSLDNQEEW